MKILLLILLVLVVLLVGLGLYVRLAPSDPARWHIDPETADAPPNGSYYTQLVLNLPPDEALHRLEMVVLAYPRTRILAGTAAEGRMTFITRSRLCGFPDYTTVSAQPVQGGSSLRVLARLRFGSGDLGVNEARVKGWLSALSVGMQ